MTDNLKGQHSRPLFPLGQLLATPGSLEVLGEYGVLPQTLLMRHVRGDWGDLCAEDMESNRFALANGLRIFSSYELKKVVAGQTQTQKVWLITEADRASSTFLLPEEY